jgi:hypothetical protein
LIDTVAMAVAARACGCKAVAAEIEAKRLGPEAIVRLFRISARRDRGHIAAVVILAGTIAGSASDPHNWRDHGERELALTLIPIWQVAEADRQAVRIVRAHWGEISAPLPSETPRQTSRRA